MKRYLAIFGFVFIGVIAGLIVRGIPIVLQVNAGGGIQADRNGDVNGDARLDMSDAIYLLLHIFRDGPQPVALAQGIPGELEGPLADIADSLARQALKDSHERFVDNQDGTITDRYTRLMWPTGLDSRGTNKVLLAMGEIPQFLSELNIGGHTDWRLPSGHELRSLGEPLRKLNFPHEIIYPDSSESYWTNTMVGGDPDYHYSIIFHGIDDQFVTNLRMSHLLPRPPWVIPVRTAQ